MKLPRQLHPKYYWNKLQRNVRYKLLLLVLIPIVLVIPLAVGGAIYWGHNLTYDQLYIKVNTDLSVSNNAFQRLQVDYQHRLERFAESYVFREAWTKHNKASIHSQVDQLKKDAGFSYLNFHEAFRYIGNNQTPLIDLGRPSKLQQQALNGQAVTGIEIFNQDELKAISESLARQVYLPLIETQYATPTERKVEDRGMMIRTLYPVKDKDGKVWAILDAGILLNGDFTLVDTIRDLVYGPGSLPEDSLGTVTLFLDDVRISTNVPLRRGERALGTRVSEVVRHQVLDQGENWVDRAFVVNDWYISGYTPIHDVDGKRVGILYAGYLETPFRNSLWQAIFALIALLVILLALSMLLSFQSAKSIFSPLERLNRVIRQVRRGHHARVGKVKSRDEIGELAREFDSLLDLLQQRNQEVNSWANELESKVERRTAELSRRNEELSHTIKILSQTRRKLVVAEKLAALGELTAGVAHEINNPAAVILGNMDMLSAVLGEDAKPVQQEINLVIEQIYRIQEILNNLLQYARPGTYSAHLETVDTNEVVKQTFQLVEHLRKQKQFTLEANYTATQPIEINAHELQQVLVNLIRNAVQAIPDHNGSITISTRDWLEKGVMIDVKDNGAGIPDEKIDKIFNPFFTTKQQVGSEGTGLGLSLSYSLIHRYGGNITATSRPGEGATFTIWLLLKPKMIEDEQELIEQLFEIEQLQDAPPKII
ncbi:sensor histidine kinase [Leucothrix pacifica]|uniref:histidine kinase n=1 Tax=Leucothrix pacifica TaxID=1247513 RepID=A0A317C937_9GAMM|nr:HAMP domain-containing sensor histidine kinase [Leucothrix pacifica]PWQ95066.1 two-component sensor histidine kinase [Leucothrix pacifica]